MIKYLLIIFISTSVFSAEKRCLVYDSPKQLDAIKRIRDAVKGDQLFGDILQSMAEIESGLDSKVTGDKHQSTYSYGLFQIKLATAKTINCAKNKKELLKIDINIECAIKYYKYLFIQLDGKGMIRVYLTVDAYNRGLGQTRKHPNKRKWRNHKYVGKLIHHMECIANERKKVQ